MLYPYEEWAVASEEEVGILVVVADVAFLEVASQGEGDPAYRA